MHSAVAGQNVFFLGGGNLAEWNLGGLGENPGKFLKVSLLKSLQMHLIN